MTTNQKDRALRFLSKGERNTAAIAEALKTRNTRASKLMRQLAEAGLVTVREAYIGQGRTQHFYTLAGERKSPTPRVNLDRPLPKVRSVFELGAVL